MTEQYLVAGNRFALTMADDCPLWGRLGNYAPFRTDPDGKPVFSLEFIDKMDPVVKVPVYTEKAEEDDQPRVEIYRNGNPEDPRGFAWVFEMAPVQRMNICARLIVSEDFSRGQLAVASVEAVGEFAVNNALMLLYAFRTATLKTLELHASVILHGGKGYLFLGKSGTGKSTHSQLWLKYIPDCELMNDDNPIVRVCEDGVIRVYGSPWSGKTPCYRNMDLPVGGFVQLAQAPQNEIRPLRGIETYAALVPSISGKRWDRRIADGLHETENTLASRVPVWHLDCLPDEAAALLCSETVTKA